MSDAQKGSIQKRETVEKRKATMKGKTILKEHTEKRAATLRENTRKKKLEKINENKCVKSKVAV
jgi:hypothetical protein